MTVVLSVRFAVRLAGARSSPSSSPWEGGSWRYPSIPSAARSADGHSRGARRLPLSRPQEWGVSTPRPLSPCRGRDDHARSGGGVGRSYGMGVPLRVLAASMARVQFQGTEPLR
jgi:hypothetical protein